LGRHRDLIEYSIRIELDSVFAQKTEQLVLIAPLAMMRFLVEDIPLYRRDV
jgi:hypothetical protein